MVAETKSLVVPCPYSWPRLRRACFFFASPADDCGLAKTETRRAYCRLEGSDQLALFTIAEGQEKGSIVGSRFRAIRSIATMSEAVRSIHNPRHRTVVDGEVFGDDARSALDSPASRSRPHHKTRRWLGWDLR